MTFILLMRATAVASAAFAVLCSSASSAQSSNSYRVDANSRKEINLNLCSPSVLLTVRGDKDTDLDFAVRDQSGRIVHSDIDGTDWTAATLRPNVSAGCVDYTLEVSNLGPVYNLFSVSLRNAASTNATTRGSRGARDRNVSVHNHMAETITNLYWSNTADSEWGADRLGAGVMRATTNRRFDVSDGTGACRFNFMVKTISGREYTKRNIDVCSVSTIDFGTEFTH